MRTIHSSAYKLWTPLKRFWANPIWLCLTLALALSLPSYSVAATKAVTIETLATGKPALVDNLGPSTFVPFTVRQLANPLLAYLDYEWFRNRGVKIPEDGIRNPELVRDALNAFAWMSKGAHDKETDLTQITRELYAYFYGGDMLAGNVGSGRSAAFAEFDVKGLVTPLAKSNNSHHSNGAAITIEAIDEAIWGRILDAESIYGSNRVVAIIFTGTYVPDPTNPNRKLPRALIIREMGIRPAHHMLNWAREHGDDLARVKETQKNLLANLPYPKGFQARTQAEAFREGLMELSRREARTQARLFARRIYFGSNSASNLELKGRRLDLGDHTTQEGFTKIIRIPDESPFGETDEFLRIIEEIRADFEKTAPPNWKTQLPSQAELANLFRSTFDASREMEMLELAGVPPEFTAKLSSSSRAHAAGKAILKVALAGNETRVFMDPAGYPNTSTYDLGLVLTTLANAPDSTKGTLVKALENVITDPSLRREVASAYAKFWSELETVALKEGVSAKNLKVYARLSSAKLNRTRPDLIRGDKRWRELWAKNDEALKKRDGSIIQNYIDAQIAKNQQVYKEQRYLELVVTRFSNTAKGYVTQRTFNLKTGRFKVERIHTSEFEHPQLDESYRPPREGKTPSLRVGTCSAVFN